MTTIHESGTWGNPIWWIWNSNMFLLCFQALTAVDCRVPPIVQQGDFLAWRRQPVFSSTSTTQRSTSTRTTHTLRSSTTASRDRRLITFNWWAAAIWCADRTARSTMVQLCRTKPNGLILMTRAFRIFATMARFRVTYPHAAHYHAQSSITSKYPVNVVPSAALIGHHSVRSTQIATRLVNLDLLWMKSAAVINANVLAGERRPRRQRRQRSK